MPVLKRALSASVLILVMMSSAHSQSTPPSQSKDGVDPFRIGMIKGGIAKCIQNTGSMPREWAVAICSCAMGVIAYTEKPEELNSPEAIERAKVTGRNCALGVVQFEQDK